MKVKLDAQGYIEQYVLVGENPDCTIEVIEPDDFDICHYKAYRIVGEQCILDIERLADINIEMQKNEIRQRREEECFSYINRGMLWYNRLTPAQEMELKEWYDAWLDAPETRVVPDKLQWLDGLTQ